MHGVKKPSFHSLALLALHSLLIDNPDGKIFFVKEIPIEMLDHLDDGIRRPISEALIEAAKDDEILLL